MQERQEVRLLSFLLRVKAAPYAAVVHYIYCEIQLTAYNLAEHEFF